MATTSPALVVATPAPLCVSREVAAAMDAAWDTAVDEMSRPVPTSDDDAELAAIRERCEDRYYGPEICVMDIVDDVSFLLSRIDAALAGTAGDGWRGMEYVIWSNEHSMWWGPNRAGYAWRLSNAGRYTRDEALEVAKYARGGWPVEGAPPEIALPLADAEHCYPTPPAQEDGSC